MLTDALNREKSYTYNDNDQLTSVKMPKMQFTYEYDLNGELSSSTLPSGIKTNYIYNSDGQLSEVNNGDDLIDYEYDGNGNTIAINRNGQKLKELTYNSENNNLLTYGLGLFSQKYNYDDQERVTKSQTQYDKDTDFTQAVIYKENSDDIEEIKYSVDDNISHTYKLNIDVTNNKSTLSLNNDLLTQVSQMNDSNLLNSLVYTTKKQSPFEINYEYTKDGNISKEKVNNNVSSFEYDKNDQLIKEILSDGTINSYEYDTVGNRLLSEIDGETSIFTYNDANQIKTKNDINFEYDLDGNLTKDENYLYMYNQQQRLIKVTSLDGNTIASYTYDEDGLRLTKTVGDTTHEYFYNNEGLDMEVIKKNNEIIAYNSYEWNGNKPLGMIVKKKNDLGDFKTDSYQFITNQRGDVLSIRDKEDTEVGTYKYDAYGNILNVDGEIAEENPIRYAGYYYDKETKNYYLEARYYNPKNGSFLALDPHPGDDDEPLSQNGYSYANGNPIINVDPEGLKPNRIHYALMTGLAYVVDEIVSTFTDFTWLVLTVYDVIKGYTDVKKAHKQNQTVQSKKIIEKSKTLKKQIEQIVRKKAIKAGISVFKRSLGGAYLLSRFVIGIVQGARDKYFKDANCFRNGASYGKYVVQKRLH